MVYSIAIRNVSSAPIPYLRDLKGFGRRKKFEFVAGTNIIIGENGSGKTTLLNLIRKYLLVGTRDVDVKNITGVLDRYEKSFNGGVDVVADYGLNTFRLVHADEFERNGSDFGLQTHQNFNTLFNMLNSSTGEGVIGALDSLFGYMFSADARLKIDYLKEIEDWKGWHKDQATLIDEYLEYIKANTRRDDKRVTVLMDEPDRNLSLENISQIKNILTSDRPDTQLIVTLHNPLLIYALSSKKDIHFIELTKGYLSTIKSQIENIVKE